MKISHLKIIKEEVACLGLDIRVDALPVFAPVHYLWTTALLLLWKTIN